MIFKNPPTPPSTPTVWSTRSLIGSIPKANPIRIRKRIKEQREINDFMYVCVKKSNVKQFWGEKKCAG